MRRLVFVGFACNNRCLYCAQGELRSALGLCAEADVERALDAVAPGDVAAFVGEPTLAPALPAWVARAARAGAARVLVQTNARRLAYPAYVRTLAPSARALALDVSLAGSSAAMHDYHTRAPGSFAETGRGIRNARLAGIAVGATVVVTRSNYRHLVEIVTLARALGVDAIHFADLEARGTAATRLPSLEPTAELAAPHVARAVAAAERAGLRVVRGPPGDEDDRFAGTGPIAMP